MNILRQTMPPSIYLIIFCTLGVCVFSIKYCNNGFYKIRCDHGSCKNESWLGTEKCVCDRGWGGPSCESCGGRVRLLANTSGFILDGRHNYSLDTKCTWLIEGQPAVPIQLSFQHFATECSWDHLYIYDGDSVYSPLLAAFSGLMVTDHSGSASKKKDMLDLTVRSGTAYLHFYSDAAYNMSGFDIAYRTKSCPKNCSGHGTCRPKHGWTCLCDPLWMGDACNKPRCPNNCSNHGICESHNSEPKKCNCFNNFRGIDCSIPDVNGVWSEVLYEAKFKNVNYLPWGQEPDKTSLGRASHKSVLIENNIYIVGGYDFNVEEEVNILKYNVIQENMEIVELVDGEEAPRRRYGHSLVAYKNQLFMFGGVKDNTITNELWVFDITDRRWYIWSNPQPSHPSYAVVGHTAHVIDNVMYVVFGHSPVYGYVNFVQELSLGSMHDYKWSQHNATGAIVKGGYGHTSVYDPNTKLIYVHGGYLSGSTAAYHLSDSLYSFDPKKRHWRILKSSRSVSHPQYLHSSVITDGLILVYGGNTHNDTSVSKGAKCYSSNFIAYDIKCDNWYRLDDPLLSRDTSRFGHIAEMYSYKDTGTNTMSYYMYIFGGFNGQMMSDLLKYTPGNCRFIEDEELCLSSNEGVVCVWMDNKSCVQKSNAILEIGQKSASLFVERECKPHSEEDGKHHCKSLTTCSSCVETSYSCVWCDKRCVYKTCDDAHQASDLSTCTANFSSENSACSTLHNCKACLNNSHCTWNGKKNKQCQYSTKPRSAQSKKLSIEDQCPLPCHKHPTCENCTSNECMWCSNQVRCVEPNAYVASFPYGQCMEWTTNEQKCPATRCFELRTCNECQSNPACGWCYDKSNTGLGQCMEGSLHGALNSTLTCPGDRWYFVECPLCQCNGHSTCKEGTSTCLNCKDLTTGPQCQFCREGYFGTPTNGGNCTACQCNGQADTCDRIKGNCYCRTRGVMGDKCNVCDKSHKYYGSPGDGGTCFYELATDYQFTFNMSKPEDSHFTQINFQNIPSYRERDVDFQINCSSHAKINITIRIGGFNNTEETLISELPCTSLFKDKFSHKRFPFGKDHNTTFYVYVYGFSTPFWLLIAFSQFPQIDLLHFFVTFISCFLSLLLIAIVLWKVKQKYDLYRRAQRMRVEREQWANRPFGTAMIIVDNTTTQYLAQEMMLAKQATVETAQQNKHAKAKHKGQQQNTLSRKKPGCIAIEPLHNNRTGVVTVVVQLPFGDEECAPPGVSGIAIGTSMVALGSSQRNLLEQTKTDKSAVKVQISNQNNCPEYIV